MAFAYLCVCLTHRWEHKVHSIIIDFKLIKIGKYGFAHRLV